MSELDYTQVWHPLTAAVVVNGLECVCLSVRRDAGRGTEGATADERERAVAAAAEAFLIVQRPPSSQSLCFVMTVG